MKKERRIVCRGCDIQGVCADEFFVLAASGNCFELRPLGEIWCQHRYEFHLFRHRGYAVDLGICEWTSGNENSRYAVGADFRVVLLTNDHDVLTWIGDTQVRQSSCRKRSQPECLGRLGFVIPT